MNGLHGGALQLGTTMTCERCAASVGMGGWEVGRASRVSSLGRGDDISVR